MQWSSLSIELQSAARILWNFHHVGGALPDRVDLLLVTGSHDIRVAERAAQLLGANVVSPTHIVVTGGLGKVTRDSGISSEAQRFALRMKELGIDTNSVILEPTATNSGENFTNTKTLLDRLGYSVTTGLIVTKPYMERRMVATGQRQWPGVRWAVTSPAIEIEYYSTSDSPLELMLNLMVGDLQRLDIYADKGYLERQMIPDDVWAAFDTLKDAGFDQQVMTG